MLLETTLKFETEEEFLKSLAGHYDELHNRNTLTPTGNLVKGLPFQDYLYIRKIILREAIPGDVEIHRMLCCHCGPKSKEGKWIVQAFTYPGEETALLSRVMTHIETRHSQAIPKNHDQENALRKQYRLPEAKKLTAPSTYIYTDTEFRILSNHFNQGRWYFKNPFWAKIGDPEKDKLFCSLIHKQDLTDDDLQLMRSKCHGTMELYKYYSSLYAAKHGRH